MTNFEDIRPYNDDELPEAIARLMADERFLSVVNILYPDPVVRENVLGLFSKINQVDDFQNKIILTLLSQIENASTKGVSFSTMDQFHPEDNYLFISNHRDIILDSAFLNMIMHKNGFRKTEIAIGDNLLIYDWITTLVRINRTFIVKRSLGLREQLSASKTLSAYIRFALTKKGESVWIAQREGRTKDGNDQTQPALLKMFNMSNKGSLLEGFYELNIVPMAISYEIEPCGILKVEEILKRKYNPCYKKTKQDDIKSMSTGVTAPKGRIHFAFGNPLNFKLIELIKEKNTNEAIQSITEHIDKRIYFNYKLWPNNYIAFDLLNNGSAHTEKYSEAEKETFVAMMNKEVASINFEKDEATTLYLQLYANPVINFEKHFG
jgi:1-acyl-sn-glycerol-3-phosphate acyltransferase